MKDNQKSQKRRQYDAAFKANVLQLHKDGRSIRSLSESFGINENILYRWRKAITKEEVNSTASEKEVKQLRQRVAELETEWDILKKALGIFSRHP